MTAGMLTLISAFGNVGSSANNIVSTVGNITATAGGGDVYINNTGTVNLGTSSANGTSNSWITIRLRLQGTSQVQH